MPSTSDGSTPGTPDATLRLSSLLARPETAIPAAPQAAVNDLSDLLSKLVPADEVLAQLPPADEQWRLFVDAATNQREQMELFLVQQNTPEEGPL